MLERQSGKQTSRLLYAGGPQIRSRWMDSVDRDPDGLRYVERT